MQFLKWRFDSFHYPVFFFTTFIVDLLYIFFVSLSSIRSLPFALSPRPPSPSSNPPSSGMLWRLARNAKLEGSRGRQYGGDFWVRIPGTSKIKMKGLLRRSEIPGVSRSWVMAQARRRGAEGGGRRWELAEEFRRSKWTFMKGGGSTPCGSLLGQVSSWKGENVRVSESKFVDLSPNLPQVVWLKAASIDRKRGRDVATELALDCQSVKSVRAS